MKSLRRLPTRLLLSLLLPPSLVIPTLGTLVAPTMALVATNNGGPTIIFVHPIIVDLCPPPTLMMVFAANCATNRVMLQVFVDPNLTIILRQRPTMFQVCRNPQIPRLSTLAHLIISLLTLTTCKHTMAWSRSPWVMHTHETVYSSCASTGSAISDDIIITSSDTSVVNQSNYTSDLLHDENMADYKPAKMPMSAIETLKVEDGGLSADATRYRRVIGKLQYLSFTRPDICSQ
ncbi:hypothetical protein KY290_031032 [Solanum tuberosum]|uniref:Integrase core domain containing protein n=1 Tax=Solanum tuberosum TaxID=4113 RepID=A0ABQ7U8V3_SOLTU|nr:hypothetical protein KY290_031032 [Solanum tuberosum]